MTVIKEELFALLSEIFSNYSVRGALTNFEKKVFTFVTSKISLDDN
jgi:hypothetical protein